LKLSDLNTNYFAKGTRGYLIISRFYYKYHDLFEKTIFTDFNDFVNQIFLNISGIDFSKEIRNLEAYIIGTIKIQCRVQLDKSIKMKNVVAERRIEKYEEEEPVVFEIPAKGNDPEELFDLQEVFLHLNLFKLQLKQSDVDLLNYLIDEKSRQEIADETQLNFNTLDTRIRRLRIKVADYFKNLGYSSSDFDKFEK